MEFDHQREGALATEERKKTKKPQRFKVLLHNDDYTTMEFVVHVLIKHFRKSAAEATQIMLNIHHRGVGIAGVYPKDTAETKVAEATADARSQGMPLLISAEPAESGDDRPGEE